MNNAYLPLRDIFWYGVMVGADVLIVMFWWFVMSRLGDR